MCNECSQCKTFSIFSFVSIGILSLFQAVNGPLQERGNTLDLDFTRANAFPVDYDTDLESDWSNPSEFSSKYILISLRYLIIGLFADGNQFSWEAIQHGRNNYYQRQQVRLKGTD